MLPAGSGPLITTENILSRQTKASTGACCALARGVQGDSGSRDQGDPRKAVRERWQSRTRTQWPWLGGSVASTTSASIPPSWRPSGPAAGSAAGCRLRGGAPARPWRGPLLRVLRGAAEGWSRIAAVFGWWRTSRGARQGSQARLPVGQADVHLAAPGRASLSSRMCRSKAWPANTPARSLASRYFTNAPFPIDQRCSRHRPERGNSPNRARRSQPVPTAPGGPDRPAPSPNATAWRGERQSPKQHDRGWVRRARIGLANDSRDLSLAVTGGRRAGCGCRAAAGPPAAVRAVAPAHTNRAMPAHPGQPQA